MQPRLAGTVPTLCAGLLLTGACAEGVGGVELTWAFVDRDLRNLYPRGDFKDTCRLAGTSNGEPRQYDLNVRLTVMGPCTDAEPIDECPPLAQETFGCDRFRGYLPEVPSNEDPYLMRVEVVVNPRGAGLFVADPSCVAVAGPREREVRPGRITDLAAYELIVDAESFAGTGEPMDLRLDLEACGG